ncbi:AhpC/TSA family protein [Sphingobacterium sp. N143]|uniref:TlpA disulfide reductase family protein n=1 Tax=Sphingobacterium sp. N143 TaxID=2746727 RepID=UPI002575FA83|nr:TlpA disulfide reductase family protein [Sphingobacterium sp. N143]MDM1295144.1 AhpC/TSA family protein [Sphingobacterium sp. N143]
MNKAIFLVVGFAGLMFSCQNKEQFTIEGNIENPGNIKVISLYEGDNKLDSMFFGDNNKFQFVRPASQSRLLSLRVGKNRYDLIASPGETISFKADMHQDVNAYQVEGSVLSKTIQPFAKERNHRDYVQDSLQGVFSKLTASSTADEIEKLRAEYKSKFADELRSYTAKAVDFSNQHNDLAGFYAISTLDPEVAESEIIAYADKIKDEFTENRYVTQFKEETQKLKKMAIGQPAPELISFTPSNKEVKLSSFKGKYTLVDFWASWCMPCRQENPNLVRLYAMYHNKGFDILSVSFDDNPGSWMRAIEDDKLSWTHVSDLKAWSSPVVVDYRVKALPTSYVLDPNGIIIAKNLRGAELESFLKKTIK